MTKEQILSEDLTVFFEALREARATQPINAHLHKLLREQDATISVNAQKFFYMLLSMQDDGNTQFSLDANAFFAKWKTKWDGLMQDCEEPVDAEVFEPIVQNGIADILKNRYTNVIDWDGESRLFVVKDAGNDGANSDDANSDNANSDNANFDNARKIYATKFYKAKITIESAAKLLFLGGENFVQTEVDKCIREIARLHKNEERFKTAENPEGEFRINSEQAQAILRGQNENLIVTGGPGTGKTTVVLYILWNLLKSNKNYLENWDIRLAAPSGKAADRMRESIQDGLNGIRDEFKNTEIYRKLETLESSTIHRLLKYIPKNGKFYYNAETQFNANTIFVIDEASMIDIGMFAALLQAIPQGARIFVLGDPFQLPSVEAGAVLGEILNQKNPQRNFVVKLRKSNRFTDDSNIGRLAKLVQSYAEKVVSGPVDFEKAFAQNGGKDTVKFETLSAPATGAAPATSATPTLTKKAMEAAVQSFIVGKLDAFAKLPELAEKVEPLVSYDPSTAMNNAQSEALAAAQELWTLSLSMRILAAERRGPQGVETINEIACKKIRGHWINYCRSISPDFIPPHKKYFPGQLLILTQNQSMYKLYNGDTGVVIFAKQQPYLMLKKAEGFVFYPLAVLPADAIESAFAITIHKSQGSEYNNVIMFLPCKVGHPLLTNQILYTGITRAKKSVTVVATPEAFEAACNTITKRDTGIVL